jgi:hypothetical protein
VSTDINIVGAKPLCRGATSTARTGAPATTVAAIDDTVRGDEVGDLRDRPPSEYGGLLDEADVEDPD